MMAALYEAYEHQCMVLHMRFLHDRYQAEDAVQEAFITHGALPAKMQRYLQPKDKDIDCPLESKARRLIFTGKINASPVIFSTEENTWIEENHNAIESYMETISFRQMLDKIRDRMPAFIRM